MNDIEQQILNTLRPFPPAPGNPAVVDKRLVGYSICVGHGLAVGAIFDSIEHARAQASHMGLKDYWVRREWN